MSLPADQTNFVFVYGTLRHGMGNWEWALKGKSTLIGYSTTPGEMYTLDGYPGAILPTTDDRAAGSTIRGEVFACNDDVLRTLDRLEGEGRMYHRRKVVVNYTSVQANVDEPPSQVYIYEYGRIPDRSQLIPDGDWVGYKFSFSE